MAAKKVSTKAPSGLSITRNGNRFTFAWKIGDKDYAKGHQLEWRTSNMAKGKWTSISIGKTTTSKSVDINPANFYPNKSTTLNTVTFRVRGARKNYSTGSGKNKKDYNPTWSAWVNKDFALAVPNVPSMTAAWSENPNNVTTFTWNTVTQNDGNKHYVNVELQSILVRECNETDGSKLAWNSRALGWATGVYSANYSRPFTEDTTLLADASYTRWVRVRARGARGASAWRYAKHVYGKPYRTNVQSATAKATSQRVYNCDITWTAAQNAAHPIDVTTVEYVVDTPVAGLNCPGGASFTPVETSRDTGGTDKANFEVDDLVDIDKCMWLRVNTEHDDNITHGVPYRVVTGKLSDPTNIDANIPAQGFTATITANNNSSVPDSFLVIVFRRKRQDDLIVGIIRAGEQSTTVTCPDWSQEETFSFGAYAVQGSFNRVTRADNVTQYSVVANTRSTGTIWTEEDVPKSPTSVVLTETETPGTIQVEWDWPWETADNAELSWSADPNAWESTTTYNSFKLTSRVAKWYIPDLEMGKKWYVRVRLYAGEEAAPWSNAQEIDLATMPELPVLSVSQGKIAVTGSMTLSWTYETRDLTPQIYAEIKECTIEDDQVILGDTIGHTGSTQGLIIYPEAVNWEPGNSYSLCVSVTSGSGKKTEFSDPVTVEVAELPMCEITDTSLEEVTVIDDEDQGITRTVLALTEMPLTLTVEGAGEGGKTSLYIERGESYHMDKPDETDFNGYEGEAVVIMHQDGEDEITVEIENLLGSLDDGAKYRIVAITEDELGQVAEARLDFEVRWDHQAVIPAAEVIVDNTNHIVKITPIQPAGYANGDVCDIYRLSVDKPELIISDALFGETYVDPYPTLNEHGGHRIVYKTKNGDYITETNQAAWTDYTEVDGDIVDFSAVIIDSNGMHIILPYNIALSSQWKKDFIETKYLGGSIQGDWNKSIERSGSINTTTVAVEDPETIEQMRRLASFPGICHVRTPDGSSFAADVQVSESMSYEQAGKLAEFSLSITKVDPEELDGMTLAEWEVGQ